MHLFFEPNLQHTFYLNAEESYHCKKVLRLKKNDIIHITDGKGLLYKALLIDVNNAKCEFNTIEKSKISKPKYSLHIAIAPPKNIKRMEWFVEKSTEIGISKITPLLCENSERKSINLERLINISVASMKQSKRAYFPEIKHLTKFTEFLTFSNLGNCYIAYQDKKNEHLFYNIPKNKAITVLVGPEGDFSKKEIEQALAANFKNVSLGKNTLRTETAGIIACQIINLKNQY